MASVYFITGNDGLDFEGQEFKTDDVCVTAGYTFKGCPSGYIAVEPCPDDGSYYKNCIDPSTWCQNNGYNVISCSVPQYLSGPCPYDSKYYKTCETDNIKACKELGYSLTCEAGKVGDTNNVCPYNSSYKKCICNPCSGYGYTASEATEQGYTMGESCNSCGTLKYKRTANACEGYLECTEGGASGAKVCYSGSIKKFSECKEVCDSKYKYDSTNCTGGYVLGGGSCGGKYESCTAPCGSQYVYDETNCPSDKFYHCSTACGNKYDDCKPILFDGITTNQNGSTYVMQGDYSGDEYESYCPMPAKGFVWNRHGYDIWNGKKRYLECSSADLNCRALVKSLAAGGNSAQTRTITLSSDLLCGNEVWDNYDNWYGGIETIIDGNGHTVVFDKVTFHDIETGEGNLTLKNLKIISKNTSTITAKDYPCTDGGSSRSVAWSPFNGGKVYVENVTVETQAEVGEIYVSGGINWFKHVDGGAKGSNQVSDLHVEGGTANVTGFIDNSSWGVILDGGTINYKAPAGEKAVVYLQKGIANVCADKLVIYTASECESGTINSSTENVTMPSKCKDKITFNYKPDLCNSDIFSGTFWQ